MTPYARHDRSALAATLAYALDTLVSTLQVLNAPPRRRRKPDPWTLRTRRKNRARNKMAAKSRRANRS